MDLMTMELGSAYRVRNLKASTVNEGKLRTKDRSSVADRKMSPTF